MLVMLSVMLLIEELNKKGLSHYKRLCVIFKESLSSNMVRVDIKLSMDLTACYSLTYYKLGFLLYDNK